MTLVSMETVARWYGLLRTSDHPLAVVWRILAQAQDVACVQRPCLMEPPVTGEEDRRGCECRNCCTRRFVLWNSRPPEELDRIWKQMTDMMARENARGRSAPSKRV